MDISLLLKNILNPPVLFFFAGMIATLVQSDLEIPKPLPKLFSLYLLLAIGFKGGHEIAKSGLSPEVSITLIAAVLLACIVPIYCFFILKIKFDAYNAAAIAASYGSISAVTFVTASSFLNQLKVSYAGQPIAPQLEYGGHMVAALALMESPAIVIGLLLVRVFAKQGETDTDEGEKFSWGEVLREAFLNGSVFLLIASLIIGLVTGDNGWNKMEPFVESQFYGALAFFLLDMGLVSAQRLGDLKKAGAFAIGFAILMPLVNAMLGIFIAKAIGMSIGNALLFAVLSASASYIAVPAAMRMSVPQANPSIYIAMSLAVTFPFNIIIGIPAYLEIIKNLWRV
jgi:uncharacterized protein